jgi:murein DD-endopeptidase MepM/ murein hydrolase activator NlpD
MMKKNLLAERSETLHFGRAQTKRNTHNNLFLSRATAIPLRATIFCLSFILLLSSCTSATATSTQPDSTSTAVIAGESPIQVSVESEATPRPTIPPFRFDLPTPGAEPVSGWRPPLYPVPWAVSAYDHFYFARPIAADNVNWPLAEYRYGAVFFAPNIVHTGIDIDAAEGTPILAAGPGTVVSADWGLFTGSEGNENDPYGKAVVIKHDFGYKGETLYTTYAHMSEIIAVVGQHVETGDVIGRVGDTGVTTGPHLHFEVRMGSNTFFRTYNPELWTAPPQGWGVLVGKLTGEKGEILYQFPVEVRPLPSERPIHTVFTYARGAANGDPYYQENMVLSDLPAGIYKILINYLDKDVQYFVEIFPGQVTYFTFTDKKGFQTVPPPAPTLDFLPVTTTPTVTPKP